MFLQLKQCRKLSDQFNVPNQRSVHSVTDTTRPICVFQWSTPSAVLQGYHSRELWIAPPQFYELSHMCRFPSLNDLHNFASQRAIEGCKQWLPVLSIDEYHISLLPGDKLYPVETSGEAQVTKSTDPQSKHPQDDSPLHCMVMSDPYITTLQITITPKYNHVVPIVETALSCDSKSQL